MIAATQQQKQTGFVSARPQLQPRSREPLAVLIARSSLMESCGLLLALLLGLIFFSGAAPVWLALALVTPTFATVCFATGTLAVMLAGERIKTSRQGGEIGWLAGYWAGIFCRSRGYVAGGPRPAAERLWRAPGPSDYGEQAGVVQC